MQVTVGLKALDIFNNVMHMVLDNGLVVNGNITLCYVIECESLNCCGPGSGIRQVEGQHEGMETSAS